MNAWSALASCLDGFEVVNREAIACREARERITRNF